MKRQKDKKEPSLRYALFVVAVCFGMVMIPALLWGAKTQPLFLLSWLVAIPLCMKLGYTYQELQESLFEFMKKSLVPMTIVLCVGAMIGVWNACGTVAVVTKLALSLINPRYFLIVSFLTCFAFSMFTGTSMGTCGTVGVALMGAGLSMGINPLYIASPLMAGAFFGNALSPLSDAVNITAGTVGVDLMKTVKYQAVMTVPSVIITAIVYFIWGLTIREAGVDFSTVQNVIEGIEAGYKTGIISWLPLVIVLLLLLFKVPTIPSILSGAASGFLLSWLYQGHTFAETAAYAWEGFTLAGENEFVSEIFSRGGITSMSGIAFMFVSAFGLFGILSGAKIIDKIVEPLMKRTDTRISGVISTVILGFIANATSASGNFSYIFTGNLLKPVYEKNNLDKWDLTRAMTVGCLLTGLLIPWNTNPLTACGFFDVEPVAMLPYTFTPYVTLAVLMFLTVTDIDRKFRRFT